MAPKKPAPEKPRTRPSAPPTEPRKRVNRLAALGMTTVDYKDVQLLRTFISDRGKIRPRHVSGLTKGEQRDIAMAIKNAREMALLPYPGTVR